MAEAHATIATFAQPRGNLACRHAGCARADGVSCHYIDGAGRRCKTSWCPDHWRSVGGVVYCRRHANTVIALGGDLLDTMGLPDLDNRGPSLVNWVYRDVDSAVRRALDRPGHAGATRDAAVTMILRPGGARQWERGWTTIGDDGMRRRVVVAVAEDDDATVLLLLDGVLVAQGVPPWIERHRRGIAVAAGVDATQRRLFYSFLVEHVGDAVIPLPSARAV